MDGWTRWRWLAGTVACAVLQGCGGGGGGGGLTNPPIEAVANPNEQWTLSTPADVGMDAATLSAGLASLPAPSVHKLASLIVARHGQPVLEQYWNGNDKDSMHDLWSGTKSITSLLTGIAIDQQSIASVGNPIAPYLSAAYPGAPVLQRGIDIEDLLTMRSGLACNDWDPSSPGYEEKMYATTDWLAFWLALPPATEAVAGSVYCTGNVIALGRVLEQATGTSVPAFAATNLLTPLGITQYQWSTYDDGQQTDTGNHLYMRPRDMFKVGQMALQRGLWNGTQIVSSAWIDESTSMHSEFDLGDGNSDDYGYLWWLGDVVNGSTAVPMYYSNGSGGQRIFVIPSLDMVVVFTADDFETDAIETEFDLLQSYILPAVAQ